MSNLFKQYNIVQPEKDARVMDYNSIIEQKLKKLAMQQNAGAEEEGFRSLGTVAEEVVPEDPQEVLQKAKDEAAETLKRARDEAGTLIGDAKKRAEEILIKAREDGHREGYDEGMRQIKEELEMEYGQRKEELEKFHQDLQEKYDREMHEIEPKLLDVILTVVEKVFHIQFHDKSEILLFLIENAIGNIEGCKSFRIRVGEDQRSFLESRRDEILDRIGHDMSIEIVSDASCNGNQCVIETDTGVFDCSMDVQLKNLIKDLKSLSS